jgi:hypothetical protein
MKSVINHNAHLRNVESYLINFDLFLNFPVVFLGGGKTLINEEKGMKNECIERNLVNKFHGEIFTFINCSIPCSSRESEIS